MLSRYVTLTPPTNNISKRLVKSREKCQPAVAEKRALNSGNGGPTTWDRWFLTPFMPKNEARNGPPIANQVTSKLHTLIMSTSLYLWLAKINKLWNTADDMYSWIEQREDKGAPTPLRWFYTQLLKLVRNTVMMVYSESSSPFLSFVGFELVFVLEFMEQFCAQSVHTST